MKKNIFSDGPFLKKSPTYFFDIIVNFTLIKIDIDW